MADMFGQRFDSAQLHKKPDFKVRFFNLLSPPLRKPDTEIAGEFDKLEINRCMNLLSRQN